MLASMIEKNLFFSLRYHSLTSKEEKDSACSLVFGHVYLLIIKPFSSTGIQIKGRLGAHIILKLTGMKV